MICNYLDNHKPKTNSYKELITFVLDRPGHDFRYAINTSKIENNIGWDKKNNFQQGLFKTINWYLKNLDWCNNIFDKSGYDGQRLGIIK